MDLIAIEGMKFYAYHGYYEEEQKIGGWYVVDAYFKTNFTVAAQKDDLTGTINYEDVFNICKQVMAIPAQLLEYLADQIVTQIQQLDVDLHWLKVRVSKLNPPILGNVGRTYVEMERNG